MLILRRNSIPLHDVCHLFVVLLRVIGCLSGEQICDLHYFFKSRIQYIVMD